MAKIGTNLKITAAKRHRDSAVKTLTHALGAEHKELPNGFHVFLLEDRFNIGIYFVDEGGMTADFAKDHGVWLEFLVEDKAKTDGLLRECGVEPFDYAMDADNAYYVLPGGPVFRLTEG